MLYEGNHYVTGFPDPPRVVKEVPGAVEVSWQQKRQNDKLSVHMQMVQFFFPCEWRVILYHLVTGHSIVALAYFGMRRGARRNVLSTRQDNATGQLGDGRSRGMQNICRACAKLERNTV